MTAGFPNMQYAVFILWPEYLLIPGFLYSFVYFEDQEEFKRKLETYFFIFIILFQFRVITELVWPLILFVILAWVRTKGLKDYESECKDIMIINLKDFYILIIS